MKQSQYVILIAAIAGREQEFEQWYDQQHLRDVLKVDGVVRARRFRINYKKTTELSDVDWHSMVIYDIESDDPGQVIAAISAAANTPAMPVSDAVDKKGMSQLLVEQVCEITL